MAAILYPSPRFQVALRHCAWLGLLGLIVFVAILATEVDFPGKGLCLMLTLVPGIAWLVLKAIRACKIL